MKVYEMKVYEIKVYEKLNQQINETNKKWFYNDFDEEMKWKMKYHFSSNQYSHHFQNINEYSYQLKINLSFKSNLDFYQFLLLKINH
jgi:hypothetical protein